MVSDSNGIQKDVLPEKEASSDEGKETSDSLEVLTKADVDKIRSDMSAAHGREKKSLEQKLSSHESELTSAREELTSLREENDRKAYEAFKDDPTGYEAHKRGRDQKAQGVALKQREKAVEQKEADHADLLAASEKTALLLTISELATEFGVSKDSIQKFNPTSSEHAREIAQNIKDLGPRQPRGETQLDPGVGSGAGRNFDGMSAEEKIRYAVEHPKKKTS